MGFFARKGLSRKKGRWVARGAHAAQALALRERLRCASGAKPIGGRWVSRSFNPPYGLAMTGEEIATALRASQ